MRYKGFLVCCLARGASQIRREFQRWVRLWDVAAATLQSDDVKPARKLQDICLFRRKSSECAIVNNVTCLIEIMLGSSTPQYTNEVHVLRLDWSLNILLCRLIFTRNSCGLSTGRLSLAAHFLSWVTNSESHDFIAWYPRSRTLCTCYLLLVRRGSATWLKNMTSWAACGLLTKPCPPLPWTVVFLIHLDYVFRSPWLQDTFHLPALALILFCVVVKSRIKYLPEN